MNGPIPRIVKETLGLSTSKVPGIQCTPDNANYNHFYVTIDGPKLTPYQGGKFDAQLLLPDDYPMSPPKVVFCKILQQQRQPRQNMPGYFEKKLEPCLANKVYCPNPDDPLNNQAANHWKTNQESALLKAKQYTNKYAKK